MQTPQLSVLSLGPVFLFYFVLFCFLVQYLLVWVGEHGGMSARWQAGVHVFMHVGVHTYVHVHVSSFGPKNVEHI